jgi:iron complex outermembrane receptor protein
VQAHARLVLRANLSLTEARFRSGLIGTNDVSSKHIPLVPRETLNVSGEWRIEQRWMLAGSLRHVGKQYYDNDQTNTFPTRMPAYEVVDLKLMHDMKGGRVSLLLNNLFDKQYYSYGIRNTAGTSFNAYPQRPRTLMLGLELSI